MDVFSLRNRLIKDYAAYIRSFINIKDERIRTTVAEEMDAGLLWPEPLLQLNPAFEHGPTIDDLVEEGVLHPLCRRIFRLNKQHPGREKPLRLYRHQANAVHAARTGDNYVLTTGTGSGKSLAYIVPIVDHVLRHGSGKGVKAIIVYPMNALANSQYGELQKFLAEGFPDGQRPVTFERYTGQESREKREAILTSPPDVLLTNYVMLELLMTRPFERDLVRAAQGLRFLVLDELHTYRGRQGADVGLLVRRVRERLDAHDLQCVGTSATLSTEGSHEKRQASVAQMASRLFGSEVKPSLVIGETLRRATTDPDFSDPVFRRTLTERVADANYTPSQDYASFVQDPLSIWIESTFGVKKASGSERLERAHPRPLSGAGGATGDLVALTDLPAQRCTEVIQEGLLASYACEPDPETGFRPFAFRLHQFIGRGDTVYASPEAEDARYLTVNGQQYVPGDRSRVLLQLAFCRECGQEYYTVRRMLDPEAGRIRYVHRELRDQQDDPASGEAGFLYISTTDAWPDDEQEVVRRIPDDWMEAHRSGYRVRRDRRKYLPLPIRLLPNGIEMPDEGMQAHFVTAPFRFCLQCGVAYEARQSSDFAKLATLSSEGRSTATTILSLAAVRGLREEEELSAEARKLLSFTDNRQDASLQAGHFNDFVEIGLLRAALYRAVFGAGASGIRYDALNQEVFDILDLPVEEYASDPDVRFLARQETNAALRGVLGYRLYRDLKRGWRITTPNLEQCGLLEITYASLDELCAEASVWESLHPALANASPEIRQKVAKTLLDYMRRELALKVDYLDATYQERLLQQSGQRLREPWSLDENERLETASVLYPRTRRPNDFRGHVFLSPRGGFGLFLGRKTTFPDHPGKIDLENREQIIRELLEALRLAGLVQVVDEPTREGQVPGYQIPASAMRWLAGDGTRAFHDPIRIPALPEGGASTNAFFVDFYRNVAAGLFGFEAREHTAQVPYEDREEREDRFRSGDLPVLYCSPTMELGVDIATLNVVNMRNVPPTPANYAQRSGRAGRSGQPALVFSYCSTGSSHDQYFFRRPHLMVAGAVSPPRLDLANEDLLRAHVQAIWLAESGLSLGTTLRDVLDLEGDEPSLDLLASVEAHLRDENIRRRALERAGRVLVTLVADLAASGWYSDAWLGGVMRNLPLNFEQACDRWRGLYRSALYQAKAQDGIIRDPTRPTSDKRQAERLRREAEEQLKLLTEAEHVVQSDFYSYRYFASEGFLPGYSFPRLPLSAFIPARRGRSRDEFLQRPRFLAISEFGPRAIVYHEGSRYIINKVILPVGEEEELLTRRIKRCGACGYLHHVLNGEDGLDLCERCDTQLGLPLAQLFRLQNVSTKRRDRINSDEEERMRLGYEVISAVRFSEQDGRELTHTARVTLHGADLARLTYGHAATLWRINLGWSRRKKRTQYGFVLDVERGYWGKSQQIIDDPEDPMSERHARVIPYVEDRRNCLLFEPVDALSTDEMTSLMAALKNAIQVRYQLEDDELAAEMLPDDDEAHLILFYEAAEGGAGVLRHLASDEDALSQVAREALALCHFDPDTGEDLEAAPGAREACEAACYDCLMSYYNQRYHERLDRKAIRDDLLDLAGAQVLPAQDGAGPDLDALMQRAGSELERSWLRLLDGHGLRLPSSAQAYVEACRTRPDFLYEDDFVAVYVDGPPHDYEDRQKRDLQLTTCMEDYGYTVLRFHHEDDWLEKIRRYPHVFGKLPVSA